MKNSIHFLLSILFFSSIQYAMEPESGSDIETLAPIQTLIAANITQPVCPILPGSGGYYLGVPEQVSFVRSLDSDPKQLPKYCKVHWKKVLYAQESPTTPYIYPSASTITAPLEPAAQLKYIAPAFLSLASQTIPSEDVVKQEPITRTPTIARGTPVPANYFCREQPVQKVVEFVEVNNEECKKLMEQKDRYTEQSRILREKRKAAKKAKTETKK